MDFQALIQVLIASVLLGGLYALAAFGLSIIYGVVRILNFAHGSVLAVAGVLASIVCVEWRLPPLLAALLLGLAFAVAGYAFFATLIHPLLRRSRDEMAVGSVLVTAGTLLVLTDVTARLAGATQRNIRVRSGFLQFGEVIVLLNQMYLLAGVAALALALHFGLKWTWFGRALRATAQDALGAQVCAVREDRIKAATFAFGCAITAIAGVLYAMSFPIDPYMGLPLSVKAFTIIVLGGIGSFPGTLWAGMLLGVTEGLTGFYWSPNWSPAIALVLLLTILVAFPRRGIA